MFFHLPTNSFMSWRMQGYEIMNKVPCVLPLVLVIITRLITYSIKDELWNKLFIVDVYVTINPY